MTWIDPLSNVAAVDQSRLAQLRSAPGVTGPTRRQSSAPVAPPVLPTVIVSATEPPGSTSVSDAFVFTVGVSGGAGAVSPTLGGSAGSSGTPAVVVASDAALFQATMLTNWGGTVTRTPTVNCWAGW